MRLYVSGRRMCCRRGWKAIKPGVAMEKATDTINRTEKSGGKRIRIVSELRGFLRAVIGLGEVEFGSCHVENVWNLGFDARHRLFWR